ncbi:carbohydrate ABC transporter permease [Maritimibacter sp. HL-12]|uniref:carbohydrate ABC transporter permease n=1 Tax=Maritimibacter sp. HL-12 TaxID=1162418 RepID=UPI000A0F336C|nr:sugar ABC transporter permease [Maritimibacter sp. HL-12]SMH56976.1 maltose ABC transporter membrane protein/trehalose ABC transporter membrane protein/sucrose ABC transporter membrane protein [Maritimibacter sp. HL-12]
MQAAFQGLLVILIGVGAAVGYFYFSNVYLDKVVFPARTQTDEELRARRIKAPLISFLLVIGLVVIATFLLPVLVARSMGDVGTALLGGFGALGALATSAAGLNVLIVALLAALGTRLLLSGDLSGIGQNINRANLIRPWLFLGPALFALGLYLAYPVVETLRLSLTDRVPIPGGDGAFRYQFVGLDNYIQMMGEPKFWEALRNNFFWLLVVPAMSTVFGLLAAQLTDRLSWGNIAKSMIFMPMAISFVGASVIWKLVYDFRPAGSEQIGILNALVVALGGEPQTWLTVPFWNSFLLMVVLIWIQTGFAMVILSAALRGIPEETIEAAIVDGANPLEIFFKIKVPQIAGTIVVVWTTITLVVLKIFDIVFAMTNGQWETQVLANYMYAKLFTSNDWGVGSASAIVIMLLVLPILIWNVRNARKEMR